MENNNLLSRIERVVYKPTCALLGITMLSGITAAIEHKQDNEQLTETIFYPEISNPNTVVTENIELSVEAPEQPPITTTTTSSTILPVDTTPINITTVIEEQPVAEVAPTTIAPTTTTTTTPTTTTTTTLPPQEILASAISDCPNDYQSLNQGVCYTKKDNFHIVRVDMENPNITVCPDYTERPGSLGKLSNAARRLNSVVAINASFFEKNGRTLGPLACNGAWVSQDTFPQAVFEYHNDGTMKTGYSQDTLQGDVKSLKFAASGSHTIVSDGKVIDDFGPDNETSILYKQHYRTAIGMNNEKHLFLAVSETGQKQTMPELAQFMGSLGVKYAINLDGGGSSQMDVQNENVSHRGKNERDISTGIFVIPNP